MDFEFNTYDYSLKIILTNLKKKLCTMVYSYSGNVFSFCLVSDSTPSCQYNNCQN